MSDFTSGDGCLLMMIPRKTRTCTHEGRFVNRPFYWVRPERLGIRPEQRSLLLKEIDLWEVSLVTFPSNDEARISDVKNALARGEIPRTEKSKESCVMSDSPVPSQSIHGRGLWRTVPARR